MPNWVRNNLTVMGSDADVQAVKNQLSAPYTRLVTEYIEGKSVVTERVVTRDLSFWNIVKPEGAALDAYYDSLGAPGAMPFWYDWNCEFWGTKWDTDAELTEHAADHLQYVFDTAWAPPVAALVALSEQHPEVWMELEWEEEQGYGGTFVFTKGNADETASYDIPGSHQDYIDRDKDCHCEIWGERVFADCPEQESVDNSPESITA